MKVTYLAFISQVTSQVKNILPHKFHNSCGCVTVFVFSSGNYWLNLSYNSDEDIDPLVLF